ncbi:hypothetical protein [Paraburkholderia sediminicola]|uniref:hypothetical protein n=1 Tax=Paraburkholderia sediminicola TaxID=458836 RepID=UPI0026AA8770
MLPVRTLGEVLGSARGQQLRRASIEITQQQRSQKYGLKVQRSASVITGSMARMTVFSSMCGPHSVRQCSVRNRFAERAIDARFRHTLASYFMTNGGNILSLQRALSDHGLAMAMRYAHLSPEHLAETRDLSPLARVERDGNRRRGRNAAALNVGHHRRTLGTFTERLAVSRKGLKVRTRRPFQAIVPGIMPRSRRAGPSC